MRAKFCQYVLLGCALPFLTGCFKQDPVESYKTLIEKEIAELPENFHVLDKTVNVEKTDSLISPLLGTCIITAEGPLSGDEDLVFNVRYGIASFHGMQNGKWVSTKCVLQIEDAKIVRFKDLEVAAKTGRDLIGEKWEFKSLKEMGEKW